MRRQGGGRKRLRDRDPELEAALDALVDPDSRGDPMSPLRWTCKSTGQLALALTRGGHPVSADTVGTMLKEAGYRLQSNVKTKEGIQHPDRDAQFRYLNEQAREFRDAGQRLLVCADGGGSNGYRVRMWKYELSKLAGEIGLAITVCHLPPGTSKWNKIEHRLFSHISMNWRGRPLTSHEVVVELISATTTKQGLRVHAEHDSGIYPAKIVVSDVSMAGIDLQPQRWHAEWNYTIRPQPALALAPGP